MEAVKVRLIWMGGYMIRTYDLDGRTGWMIKIDGVISRGVWTEDRRSGQMMSVHDVVR